MQINVVRSFLEILYFIAGIGLLFVAIKALEQIRLAKTDIKTRVNREAAKEAAVRISHWMDVIIPSMNKLHSYQNKINFEELKCSMERFESEELRSKDSNTQSHSQKALVLIMEDSEFRSLKRFSDSPCTAWARRGTSACTNAGGPMQAYSMDLRERALLDSDAGMKAADVAVKYRVSGSWVGPAPVPWTGTDLGFKRSAATVSSRS